MKYKYPYTLFIIVWINTIWFNSIIAQNNTIPFKGIVMEKGNKNPIELATIQLLSSSDSTFIQGANSSVKGEFSLSAPVGKYILKVSSIGFITQTKLIEIKKNSTPNAIERIYLASDEILLGETVITAEALSEVVSGDSIIYNPAAYPVAEGAVLEDLVKLLPGAEMSEEGKLMINGEEVKKILVDGEEYFAENMSKSLKNLPAEMFEKLKTYKKKSDKSRISGIEDGEEEMVLDLSIKKNMKKGWNGNINPSYGDKGRYALKGMLNRFEDKDNISIVGSVSDRDGITTSRDIGGNFSKKSMGLKYGGNVNYRNSDRNSWTKRSSENFQNNGKSQFSNSRSDSKSDNNTLSASFQSEWEPDTMTNIIFKPTFNYADNHTKNIDFSERFNNEHVPQNRRNSSNSNQNDKISTNGTLQVNRRLNNKGRNITLNLSYGYNDGESDRYNLATTENFNNNNVKIQNQYISHETDAYNYKVQLTYIEPVFNKRFLEFSYRYGKSSSTSEKYTYDWNEELEAYNHYPDTALSNCYKNVYTTNSIQTSFRTVREKYHYTVGLDIENQKSQSHTYVQDSTKNYQTRNVINYSPNLNFQYRFSKRTNLRFNYRGRSAQPNIEDLQPVIDNSNTTNVRLGNPSLKPSFNNNLNATFNTFLSKTSSSLNINLQYSNRMNAVIRKITYNDDGGRVTQPVNTNGNWSTSGNVSFNTPLKNKKFSINTTSTAQYSNAVSFTSQGEKENSIKSNTRNLNLSERIKGTFRTPKHSVSLLGMIRYGHSEHSIKGNIKETFDYIIEANTNLTLPWELKFSTTLRYHIKEGYGDNATRTGWNAQIAKSFLKKKKATLRFELYDILRDATTLRRNVSANSISDVESNKSNTYFMGHFTYRFRTYGKRNKT